MNHIEGMTTRAMLLDGGLGNDAIDDRLARGDLRMTHRGVYRLRGVADDRRHAVIAALLALNAPVAVTDRDALWLAGLVGEPTGLIDVLVPHPRNPVRPRGVRLRSSTRFEHSQMNRFGVIPVVGTSWALTDIAKTATRRDLAKLTTRGIGARWTSIRDLQQLLELRGVFPASGKMRRLVEELQDDIAYSATERKVATACRKAGFRSVLNRPVFDHGGREVAMADICFEDARLIVEVDGPHHWLPEVAAADRVRDRLLQSLGWKVIRFTVYEVDADLAAVVAEITRTHAVQLAA